MDGGRAGLHPRRLKSCREGPPTPSEKEARDVRDASETTPRLAKRAAGREGGGKENMDEEGGEEKGEDGEPPGGKGGRERENG